MNKKEMAVDFLESFFEKYGMSKAKESFKNIVERVDCLAVSIASEKNEKLLKIEKSEVKRLNKKDLKTINKEVSEKGKTIEIKDLSKMKNFIKEINGGLE